MAQVHIPPALRSLTDGQRVLDVEGQTVREVIKRIDCDHPGFRERVTAGDRLKPEIAIAVGSRISDMGLLETLQTDDEVHFVISVSGG
jgi:sulfur-carrier protein